MRIDPERRSRGAVALVTAVSMIAIFGFTALSVDLGNAWQNRRSLVGASDAAALAAASDYALNSNGCASTAATFITNNNSNATLVQCTPSEGAQDGDSSGYVFVEAEATVDYAFAPVIGVDSKTSTSSTVARYGIPLSLLGLRPFGFCYDTLVNTQQYMDWILDTKDPSEPVPLIYSKDSNPTDCNDGEAVPGNWATLDFDGGANSNSDTQAWTLNGYPNLVEPEWIPGDTGAFSPSLASELQYLQEEGIVFPIPLFDQATGNGSNASFHVVSFISVRVLDFTTAGSQENRSLTLQFVATIAEGACCDASGIDMGIRVLQICAVDDEDISVCDPSASP